MVRQKGRDTSTLRSSSNAAAPLKTSGTVTAASEPLMAVRLMESATSPRAR